MVLESALAALQAWALSEVNLCVFANVVLFEEWRWVRIALISLLVQIL